MVITQTPFRISFVGGGSDLESFYSQHPGAVLSTSINKYIYISSHNFFDENQIRLKYSQTETVKSVDEIEHRIMKQVLKKFDIHGAIEISSNGDVPSGTGLGSSSSFTVGLLHNLYARSGKFVNKQVLAEDACDIEIIRLQEPIGKQDQYAAAYGGLNIFRFLSNGSVEVEPLYLRREVFETLEENLLMFYYGQQRATSSILTEQKGNMEKMDKIATLKEMVGLVPDLRDALYAGRLNEFGKILHENWLLKTSLASRITDDGINQVYPAALGAGAIGGKLLGAGGGGFFLFYCEKQNHSRLREALKQLREMPFRFDNEGTKVIYYGSEE